MLATSVMTSNNTIFINMVNQAIKVSHLHILKLSVANFKKIKSTQILIKGEGVLYDILGILIKDQ